MTESNPITAAAVEKSRWRDLLLERRSALSLPQRQALDTALQAQIHALPEWQSARHVFSYISHADEPDTRRLIDWCIAHERRVSVPRLLGPGQMHAVEFPGWNEMAVGHLELPQPSSGEAVTDSPDICLVPGVGYTTNGDRLGHGGGYYDRWLAGHNHGLIVAPVYPCQLVEALPVDIHDIRVDILILPDRVIRIPHD